MKKYEFTGKNYEDAIKNAKIELQEYENDLIIKEKEVKNGIFNKKVTIEVIRKNEIPEFIKEYVRDLVSNIGLNANLELKKRDETLNITIYTDNNALLIGKNGKNIEALNNIVRHVVQNEIGELYKVTIDVNEYKEKKQEKLIKIAKMVAREVKNTKIEAKLDPMNSYERRLIHNELSKNKYVYTESVGEEPNRCIVIKPREEEK